MKTMTTSLWLFFITAFVAGIQTSHAVPITGNPQGHVTLVEYYDYECPYCRRMEPVIEKLEARFPQLRVVHRVTPLLTPESRSLASFTLAAEEEGQWQPLHQALINLPTTPTLSEAEQAALKLGCNLSRLLKLMQQPSIQQQWQQSIRLAATHVSEGKLALPILVFGKSDGAGPHITLTGEQSYGLLSAIVQQLSER